MLQASTVHYAGNNSSCSQVETVGIYCTEMAAQQQLSIWAVYS